MLEDRVDRRLAAILIGDIAGYSRLMGADEEGTHRQLKAHRKELIDPKITEYRGRIVRTTGDGILVEFVSVIDAVRCAVDIQRGMVKRNSALPTEKRIEFRIGINIGDIIIDEGDIFGDGVNVAARLETLAEPGGIMVSGIVHDQVRDKLGFGFEDMGVQFVKNIIRPVRTYRIETTARVDMPHTSSGAPSPHDFENAGEQVVNPAVKLPEKPSIAVLPFQNLSGDPEQEYFADGVVEDIITALSRMRWLFVIARNSSFTYKGRAVDVKQVGRELGVRYVLEGSVRKATNRVRITAQLIDTSTGAHFWADHLDGTLEDIFDLQDRVTASVVGAIGPKLEQAEIERAKHKRTESLDAYDYFLRGMARFYLWTREANDEALKLFYKAIERDPDFAPAYALAAWCYVRRKGCGWMNDREQEIAEAASLARRAVKLGKDDAIALARGGHALGFLGDDLESGLECIDRALVLNPNLAIAWYLSGWLRVYRGEPEVAIEHLARAMRLSPLDPTLYNMQAGMGIAHFLAGRFDDASSWAEKASRDQTDYAVAPAIAAASHALAGRLEEARQAMGRLRQNYPALRISNLRDWLPIRRSEHFTRWTEGLRKAGLPE
jgi:TolB-like protein/class 3 adenylate cyclase/tetratricopeptide (TPR) repeat protein